jgi:hypothetical protein
VKPGRWQVVVAGTLLAAWNLFLLAMVIYG